MGDSLVGLIFISLFTLPCPAVEVQSRSQETIAWRTGRDLDRGVRIGITGTWRDTPLEQLLNQLSRQRRIALFMDRRVDPTTKIELVANDLTWEQFLAKVGKPMDCFFCRMEDVYYFGPRKTCLALPDVYARLRQQLKAHRSSQKVNWRIPIAASWPRLSRPQNLLLEMGKQFEFEIYSADRIDHDLWREFDAPQVTMMLKAILLTTGFDKSIAISKQGDKLKVVNFPNLKTVSWSVEYVEDAKTALRKLRGDYPQLEMKTASRKKISLSGDPEKIYGAIEELVARQKVVGGTAAPKYTFQLKATRKAALDTIAKQLNVELVFEQELESRLAQHIERDFDQAPIEDIIRGVLQDSGLTFVLNSQMLEIK